MARDYEDQVTFIGVGGFDDAAALTAFVEAHDLDHIPHAVTEDGELFVRFDLSYHPAWVLIAPDGDVVLAGVRPPLEDVRASLDALADG